MRTLRRLDSEVLQATFGYRFCLANIAPCDRNAEGRDLRTPTSVTDKQVLPSFGTQTIVPLTDSIRHLARAQYIKGVAAQVDDIAHIIDLSHAEGIAGTEQRIRVIDSTPVHIRRQRVGRNRTYLQNMEYLRVALKIDCKLYLYRGFDFLLRYVEQRTDDIRKREGVKLELRGKGDDTWSVGITGIDDTHVLVRLANLPHS